LGAGRVHLLPGRGQPPLELRFDSASLHLPPPAPALATLDVAELGSDFVARRRERIERARALQRRDPLGEDWPRERRRRELTAACAALGLALAAAAALPRQPSPRGAWLYFALPAAAIATLGAGALAAC